MNIVVINLDTVLTTYFFISIS